MPFGKRWSRLCHTHTAIAITESTALLVSGCAVASHSADWQANVKTSLGVFEDGYARSAFWTKREQNRLNAEYQAVEDFVNDGLPEKDQKHGRAARVPKLSEDQRIDEALKEYNSGADFHHWRFGTNYSPSPDGRSIVTLTAPGADANGWVSASGHWERTVDAWAEDPAGMKAGTPMRWIVGRSLPNYVKDVRDCPLR